MCTVRCSVGRASAARLWIRAKSKRMCMRWRNRFLRYCIYCGTPTVWRARRIGTPRIASCREGWSRLQFQRRQIGEMRSDRSLFALRHHVRAPRSRRCRRKRLRWSRTQHGARRRLAGAELLVSEALPDPALPPTATSVVVAKAANRRRDVRTRVSFYGVRSASGTEEIVECANLSKRGFAFRSRKPYPVGGEIQVGGSVLSGDAAIVCLRGRMSTCLRRCRIIIFTMA